MQHAAAALSVPFARARSIAPYNVAVIFAGLGNRESAFEWRKRAFDARS